MSRRRFPSGWMMAASVAATLAFTSHAMAWGATGHRMIGRLALEALPPETPLFLRQPAAVEAIGELAREPDRWRDAGKIHDGERDPAHFVDLDDTGRILGGPALANLPATREAYDAALRLVGADSWKAGYLPYSIVDGWQQVAKDFAYWRVDEAGARLVASPAHRAWLVADRARREALILRDVGTLAHYVGDASQPMHVSIHYNGWGRPPNPAGFTQDRVHVPFEGAFVRHFVTPEAVRAAMAPPAYCGCSIEQQTSRYLAATGRRIIPYFQLYKAGGFAPGDARGRAFATERVAAGAAQLRDMIAAAWLAGARGQVGWPAVSVADVEAGKIDPFDALYGED